MLPLVTNYVNLIILSTTKYAININYQALFQHSFHGKFLIKDLVGDLLQDEDLSPDISGSDRVSTVTSESELNLKSNLLGLSGLCKVENTKNC